eukprot:1157399-Pelagomonas_calceolata.AAC.3
MQISRHAASPLLHIPCPEAEESAVVMHRLTLVLQHTHCFGATPKTTFLTTRHFSCEQDPHEGESGQTGAVRAHTHTRTRTHKHVHTIAHAHTCSWAGFLFQAVAGAGMEV